MSAILIKKAGTVPPLSFIKQLHKTYPAGWGVMALQKSGAFFHDNTIDKDTNNAEVLHEAMAAFKEETAVFSLLGNKAKDGKPSNSNVGPYKVFEHDKFAIYSMLSGDFSQYRDEKSDYSDDFHGNAKLVMPLVSSLANTNPTDKVFETVTGVFNATVLPLLTDRSFIVLMSNNGSLHQFGKPKGGKEYDWGYVTDTCGYVEVPLAATKAKKEEPRLVASVSPEGKGGAAEPKSPPTQPKEQKNANAPAATPSSAGPAGAEKKEDTRPKFFTKVAEAAKHGVVPPAGISKSQLKKWWRQTNRGVLPDDWDEKRAHLQASPVVKEKDVKETPVAATPKEREIAAPTSVPVVKKSDVAPHFIKPAESAGKVSATAIKAAQATLNEEALAKNQKVQGDKVLEVILKRQEAATNADWPKPDAGTIPDVTKVREKLLGSGGKEIPDPKALESFFAKTPTFSEQMKMGDLRDVCGYTVEAIKDLVKNHPEAATSLILELRQNLYFEDLITQMGEKQNTKAA